MIGIGVTSHNRHAVTARTLEEIRKRLPARGTRLVVVDDASTDAPNFKVDYRFEHNVGIARAKNKCLELLEGCEHIFLFDDDTYPITDDWWMPYVQSREPHLMYVFQDFADGRRLGDTALVYNDGQHIAYSHARGCMLYFHRTAIERVGGMDPAFGKWGWEHVNLSDRIHAAGLTSFAYMDVVDSNLLIRSGDEYREVASTVPGEARNGCMSLTTPLYHQRAGSAYYIDFRDHGEYDLVLSCYFVGHPDPQRGERWTPDESELDALRDSVRAVSGVETIVLNDCFEDGRVPTGHISPYWQRWISLYEFLCANKHVRNVWCVDATDVEMLRNPFPKMQPGVIYVGDEKSITDIPWMRSNHPASFIRNFVKSAGRTPLLNCGLLGGSRANVMEFIRAMLGVYTKNKQAVKFGHDDTVGVIDMGVFNYVARTMFASRIEHGAKVNTVFKKNIDNGQAWWKHK